LLPLLQAFCFAQIGTFLSPSHCSNIDLLWFFKLGSPPYTSWQLHCFYNSSNWTFLSRLHCSSIACIAHIRHSSPSSWTQLLPLLSKLLHCSNFGRSFLVIAPLLPLLSTQDIPLSNHELHC
jgi:hypothetical protein